MRILCIGDTHQDTEAFNRIVQANPDCEIILCTGDIENYADMPKPFYFIAGNHDVDVFSNLLAAMDKGLLKLENFTNIHAGEVHAYKGLRIAGLPGNFSRKDYEQKKGEVRCPRHFTRADVENCLKLKGITLFLAHEAPLGVADIGRFSGGHFGTEPVRMILDVVQPTFLVCGHIHNQQVERHGKSNAVNVGYGWGGDYAVLDLSEKRVELYRDFQLNDKVPTL